MNQPLRVMLVDDEPLLLESLEKTFPWDELGLKVVATAVNGKEALARYRTMKPDLTITDIHMPDMDGLTFMKEILAKRTTDEVIVLSGYDEFQYVKDSLAYKAFHYLLKPLDRDELTEVLERAKLAVAEKKQDRLTKEKNRWYEAVFALNKGKENRTPLQNPAVVMLSAGAGHAGSLEAQSGETTICVYPQGDGTCLIIVSDPVAEEKARALAEDLIADAPDAAVAIGSERETEEELADSCHEAATYLKKQVQIGSRVITKAEYEAYRDEGNDSKDAIHDAKAYLEAHFAEHIRSEDLAKQFGFSPSYFSTYFKQVHGVSLSELQKQLRIAYAKDLLLETAKPAYEIALEAGYDDQRYFSQVFKKQTGMTPTAYRKTHGRN